MQINYIKIYKDECISDEIFEQYCALEHSIYDESDIDNQYVVFYTININDTPQQIH